MQTKIKYYYLVISLCFTFFLTFLGSSELSLEIAFAFTMASKMTLSIDKQPGLLKKKRETVLLADNLIKELKKTYICMP